MRLKGDVKDLQMAKKLLSGIESHFPIQEKNNAEKARFNENIPRKE